MNHFEIKKEKLVDMIKNGLLDIEGFDIYSEESAEKLNQIECYVRDAPFLDNGFKLNFSNSLLLAVEGVALEAFENGLNVGLSLLCELLSSQPPEITVHCKLAKEPEPIQRKQTTFKSNPDFLKHMREADIHMCDIEKQFIATMATILMRGNFEEDVKLIRQKFEKSLSESANNINKD